MSDCKIISPTITDLPGLNVPSKLAFNGLNPHLTSASNMNGGLSNHNPHNSYYNSYQLSSNSSNNINSKTYHLNHSHENGSAVMVNGGENINKNLNSNYNRNQQASYTKIKVFFNYFYCIYCII